MDDPYDIYDGVHGHNANNAGKTDVGDAFRFFSLWSLCFFTLVGDFLILQRPVFKYAWYLPNYVLKPFLNPFCYS